MTLELTPDKQADLRSAFKLQNGQANAYVIAIIAAAAPAHLERDGWIERVPTAARWDETYRPGPRLLEVPA